MQWYHVAIERHGSNLNGYLDGVLLGQWADFGLDNDGLGFCIGTSRAGAFTNDMNGWLDEFRISNVARYQSLSFTPPAEAYST